jgi:hypothetical protein
VRSDAAPAADAPAEQPKQPEQPRPTSAHGGPPSDGGTFDTTPTDDHDTTNISGRFQSSSQEEEATSAGSSDDNGSPVLPGASKPKPSEDSKPQEAAPAKKATKFAVVLTVLVAYTLLQLARVLPWLPPNFLS